MRCDLLNSAADTWNSVAAAMKEIVAILMVVRDIQSNLESLCVRVYVCTCV